MVLFNADGGRAEMSGNGIACLAQAAVHHGLVATGDVAVSTDAGLRLVRIGSSGHRGRHEVTIDMGPAKLEAEDDQAWIGEIVGAGTVERALRADMGNPHLVLYSTGAAVADIVAVGRRANETIPGGVNVHFITTGPGVDELTMTIYERGVGPTQACGTGVSAAAAAAVRWGLTGASLTVHQPGGPARVRVGVTVELTVPVVHVATLEYHHD
jgi:diaminopimelate epimerase